MKVGILTFHKGFNCGAYLQTLYMSRTLESIGCEVVVINYESENAKKREIRHLFSSRHPKYFCQNLIKYFRFKFAQRKLNMSIPYTDSTDGSFFSSLDAIIYGSDEIWNVNNVISGFDPVFFGAGINSGRKVAYAPSFGDVSPKDTIPSLAIDKLKYFSKLSVRDINSKIILEKYGFASKLVVDPTLLLDNPLPQRKNVKPFLLVYATSLNSEIVNKIKSFARERELVIKCVGYRISGLSSDISIGPSQFERLFGEADYIVTNTLHGTLFSIKNNKRFCLIFDKYRQNKLQSIVSLFNINYLDNDNINSFEALLQQQPDIERINSLIQRHRAESLKFLKASLFDV